jgi:hypothetical protein
VSFGVDSCPLYPTVSYLYFHWSLYVFLKLNTGTFDQKKKDSTFWTTAV